MPIEITMPRLSDSMEEGVVARWLVREGAAVERGQPLAEIDTDKATMELEAEASGTLLEILVEEGKAAPVGAPLALLSLPGEPAIASSPRKAAGPEKAPAAALSAAPAEAPAAARRGGVSPVARRLARELGVDLSSVSGTGPGGLVTKEDVERAAALAPTPSPSSPRGEVRVEPLTRVQRLIAQRMVEGSVIPDFAVEAELDMTAVVSWREAGAGGLQPPPSITDVLVRATALALREFPHLNASYSDDGVHLYSRINVGIAVAGDRSLVVPTILDADRKSLAEIAAESRRLAERARSGEITARELEGGTFTVTNLGMLGVTRFLPIINPPQVAILALGALVKRPGFDEEDRLDRRWALQATLVCDHRVVYGADAARFLARLGELVRAPQALA